MLADDISVATKLRLGLGGEHHDNLCSSIATAQRFELAEDFAVAASEISDTNMAAFANAITACRAPAANCWIEVPHSYRTKFTDTSGAERHSQVHDVVRVGVLIRQRETDDGLCYTMDLIYKSRSLGVSICAISQLVDLRDTNNIARGLRRDRELGIDLALLAKKYSGADLDAAIALENKTCIIGNEFTDAMMRSVAATTDQETVKQVVAAEVANWNGEMMFWLAAIALLNTRNLGKTVSSDVGAINRSRARRGKIPLLTYDTCSIDQSRFRIAKPDTQDFGAARHSRAHFVRGHFKMRKTGVFWWRPAVRGMAALGVKMKSYRVKHSAHSQVAP